MTANVRTDPETERALAALTADGTSRSAAIRQAILEAAVRLERRRLRNEADTLRDDLEDLAEVRRVQADMEALRAW